MAAAVLLLKKHHVSRGDKTAKFAVVVLHFSDL